MIKRLTIIASLAVLLSGCASSHYRPAGNVNSLQGLQEMNAPGVLERRASSIGSTGIRYMAIKETALSLGARAALAWRSKQIDEVLTEDATVLNAAYNFYGLMLPHDILPPVLQEAQDTLNLASPDTLRLASQVYKIKSQARFVTAPPTWRDYLWMGYPVPERPNSTLLPENAAEQSVWNQYATEGWNNGIVQADNIFSSNLASLNQDYKGMIIYLRLYQENMVTAPFVAKTNLGITGNGSQMSINDRVLRITALPQLNLRGDTWKPILVPDPLAKYKLDLMRQLHPKMAPSNIKSELYIK